MNSIDWKTVEQELAGLELIKDPASITKLSLDYYHFSPVLQRQLEDKRADIVVRTHQESEVIQVAKTCAKHKIPLTIRGAGTGNYGQCIPLEGGIILDTTQLNKIITITPGLAKVQAGVRMATLDKEARAIGWELRMLPSTYQTATIGGFIGGGSAGAGSINYGQIAEAGNVLSLRLITLEDEPKIIELRGQDLKKVIHAYGTNGIITELEIALAPAYDWVEIIVVFDDFMQSATFAQALCDSDGIVKKLVTVQADPIPSYFHALEDYIAKGKSCALLTVAQNALEALEGLVAEYHGEITYQKKAAESKIRLLEFGWNHTTLLARSQDPNLTYLQVSYPSLEKVKEMSKNFGDEVMIHLEFLRSNGQIVAAGLPIVRFSTFERLDEIIRYHRENDVFVANPHVYTIEDGGNGQIKPYQVDFKSLVDPHGLMNPGKMRGWLEKSRQVSNVAE